MFMSDLFGHWFGPHLGPRAPTLDWSKLRRAEAPMSPGFQVNKWHLLWSLKYIDIDKRINTSLGKHIYVHMHFYDAYLVHSEACGKQLK